MSSTRDRILRLIRAHGHASVAQLAEELAISPVSVRHHLAALQAEGLVRAAEVRRGVGRPHLEYSLTEAAAERFPARYVQLSERLLAQLKSTLPAEAVEALLIRLAEEMASEHVQRTAGKSLEEKLDALVSALGEEGFGAEWKRVGETIRLTEYNCPYVRLGQQHPEICTIDQTMMRQMLSADVEKTDCVLDGAERCVFIIRPQSLEATVGTKSREP
ncbi:MAG: ArsR family transcriptional regulator [Anaerolineales bacterium]|nr:ArsR family transcriptional regulator [Anaerolineales bacterium]